MKLQSDCSFDVVLPYLTLPKELKSSEYDLECEDEEAEMNEADDELPTNENVYLQQFKNVFTSASVFKEHLEESKGLNDLPNTQVNVFFSPTFAAYIFNNWCGVLLLWTSFHLRNQARHSSTEPYLEWSKYLLKANFFGR